MQTTMSPSIKIFFLLYLSCLTVSCFAEQTSTLIVDAKGSVRKIPDTFFGAFFEVIE